MRTRVKICGITRWEDARLAVDFGAAALGFNFYPPSPRYIRQVEARQMIRQLPPFVMAVGVFADESDGARVLAVAREAGVAAIQVHGPKFPAANGALENYPLIRAVATREDLGAAGPASLRASAFLVDAFDPALIGGTGKTCDWSLARDAKRYGPVILAGGLTPENVRQAISEVRPFAVDVARDRKSVV